MSDEPRGSHPTFDPDGIATERSRRFGASAATFVTLDPDRPQAEALDAGPPAPPERYERLDLLGEGGMGQVWRVRDRLLARDVAMKVIRAGLLDGQGVQRFREEARVAAGLQHPGIVPVHDLGELDDGRVWFTMKIVGGRTLEDLLQEVHRSWRLGMVDDVLPLRRLVDAFLRACEAAAYAHARGVVHRDLKPANVMVGDFGEILVLDWGLAMVLDEDRVRRTGARGPVAGTPAYMAPEQARGERHLIGPPTDVYALGATLYDLLCERPPFMEPSVRELIDRVASGEQAAPPSRFAEIPIDEGLERICLRALSPDPADRHPDAGALAAEVADWLDGADKRQRAIALVERARDLERTASRREAEATARREEAAAALEAVEPDAGEEAKWPGWDLEDEAAHLSQEADDLRIEAEGLLRGALAHAPDSPEAHARLAAATHARHAALEAAGRHAEARRLEAALREHDHAGRHARYLAGEGAISLVTDPPGAEVRLHRFETRRRRLVPVFQRILGVTPLDEVPLPMGSYLLEIRAEGREPVRYPVLVERLGHWDGVAPEGTEPHPLVLPPAGSLGPDDRYVPAGWFWSSADLPQLTEPLPRRLLWGDGLVFRRFPVTNAEYLDFLNGLVVDGREEEALQWAPRAPAARRGELGQLIWSRDAEGRFELGADAEGSVWTPRMPTVNITLAAGRAFAAWTAEREGRPWRLPTEVEWEKAARGVDGRVYPWGDEPPDPTMAQVRSGVGRRRGPCEVDRHPADESVYGLRNLAGNVLEHVEEPDHEDRPFAYGRGGSWMHNGWFSRLDVRKQLPKHNPASYIGARIVTSIFFLRETGEGGRW